MRQRTWVAAIVLLVSAAAGLAQQPPAGDGAWALRIVTEGGITGRGRGNYVLTSSGSLTCSGGTHAGCSRDMPDEEVRQIAALIDAVPADAWVTHPENSVCSDCILTTVTLRTRDGDHVHTRMARWDDSQTAGPALRSLVERVVDVSRAPLQ